MAKSNQVVTLIMGESVERKIKALSLPSTMTFTVAGVPGEHICVDISALPPAILAAAIVHGIRQKVSDAAAIPRDTKTGLSAEPSEKFDAMSEVAESLAGGEWNRRATGGGGEGSLLVRAMMEVTGKSREECREFVTAQTPAAQNAMRASAALKPIIDRIKAESAKTSGIDGDALLSSFAA